jgi:hypothetical protein
VVARSNRFAAARLLGLWVRIPPGTWLFVCCECCVLSGRGLCEELITRPEESYRMWCVVVHDLETSRMKRPWPPVGPQRHRKKNYETRLQIWARNPAVLGLFVIIHKSAHSSSFHVLVNSNILEKICFTECYRKGKPAMEFVAMVKVFRSYV